MSQFKGDFLGFTYNDKHSSEFNIVRVSDGSRFNLNLLPTIHDKSISIPGRPGKILQSSNYDTRVFQIQIAYDNMNEEQMNEMKRWLGDRKIHQLSFDETPYKFWYAKVTGNANMKWLVFDEGEDKKRIYKGEGTIQFTCYDPFAHCNSTYKPTNIDKYSEWWIGSGLDKANEYWVDRKNYQGKGWNSYYMGSFYLYNCGDIETDFQLQIDFNQNGKIPEGGITLVDNNKSLKWLELQKKGQDAYIKINTKMNLIEGYNSQNQKSGNIYDSYIKAGRYFNLPCGPSEIALTTNLTADLEKEPKIYFDYLFL